MELLAVMAIIAILAGVVAGAVTGLGATGQNAQIASDTKTISTAVNRFLNDSFPEKFPVAELPEGETDLGVRAIDFDAVLPQNPAKIFVPDFLKDIPNSAALVSWRMDTRSGRVFPAADGAAFAPPSESRLDVSQFSTLPQVQTDIVLKLSMGQNRAAVEEVNVNVPAGYAIGGQGLPADSVVGKLEIDFSLNNPWKSGHAISVDAPIVATGRAHEWLAVVDYTTATSDADGQPVSGVKEDAFRLRHEINLSAPTVDSPGTLTLEMDRTGLTLNHNEAAEFWTITIFDFAQDSDGADITNAGALVTNPSVESVYKWLGEEHSTIQVEGVFDKMGGKQVVLIKAGPPPPTPTPTATPPPQDLTAPVVISTSVGPSSIDVTASTADITVTGEFTDDISGVAEWLVRFVSPSQAHTFEVAGGPGLIAGTQLEGTFEATASLPQFSEAGPWRPSFISVTDSAGNVFSADLLASPPPAGSPTDVGGFEVISALFETNLGAPLPLTDDNGTSQASLGFTFPYFGSNYTNVYVNANGNLTFNAASSDYDQDRDEFVSGLRDVGTSPVGPAIAPLWDDLDPTVGLQFRGFDLGEVDYYTFNGVAGDIISVEIDAARSDSDLDPILTLLDSHGHVFAVSDDFFGLDSRINQVALPITGAYFLKVEDFSERGGPSFTYELKLDGPGSGQISESEPNDTPANATPLGLGQTASGAIGLLTGASQIGVFVNDQFPDRFVVTWNKLAKFPGFGLNTVQAILYEDGRIQFGYGGVISNNAIVGLSPANGNAFAEVDYRSDVEFSTTAPEAIFQDFSFGFTPNKGAITREIITFTPNVAGGFDVVHYDHGG